METIHETPLTFRFGEMSHFNQQMHAINSLSPSFSAGLSFDRTLPQWGQNTCTPTVPRLSKSNLTAQGHTPHAHWVMEEL